ncbi:hypothetical protein [Streptomyces johnsoniae]|uniref:Uncharacterized protein n=1 Tax=Streptomyces johnsoniae TaxID=3075532 RepID=A0ABU2SDV2_9ACTN|nr:hypothetical protein [Streptomyces sp. DSM 41886]MDT0447145.1 hypothetical protein [Streptomyces sp. DSM 41886]
MLRLCATEIVLGKTDGTVRPAVTYDLGGGHPAVREKDGLVHLEIADHHGTAHLSIDTYPAAPHTFRRPARRTARCLAG